MSAIINKVKAAVEGHTHKSDSHVAGTDTTGTTHSTTSGVPEGAAGPHSSRVANAADPRVDSDLDGSRNAGVHSTNTTGAGLAGTGAHNTHGTHTVGGYNNTTSTGAPLHNSAALNKVDPRVDSDMDGSRNMGATQTHGQTSHSHTAGTTGAGLTGTHATHGTHSTGAPLHNSSVLNKVDPRVDSDLDGSRNFGATQTHGQTSHSHTAGTTGAGLTGSHATHGTHATGTGYGSTNAGPHDSNLANKVDPRVDSNLDGSRNFGATQAHGTTGAGLNGSHATHGTHNTHIGNNGVTSSATHQTPGTGTAPSTAGPHNSDLLNKLDPRVDSDLDGSKTTGGNRTYA
jgi:hypothetical protein